jgi:hypothetical protein
MINYAKVSMQENMHINMLNTQTLEQKEKTNEYQRKLKKMINMRASIQKKAIEIAQLLGTEVSEMERYSLNHYKVLND